jgi:ABC-type branched-subunit amino acid transport system ATPase component/branched-subunit amino acid ABC-type transport system permease component
MRLFITFALLGLGTGGMYTLFATGLIVIHRGSGVVNFAHGAIGMVGGYVFFSLSANMGAPKPLAFVVGVGASALLGVASYLLVMRPLRKHPPVVRLIATLGILTVLEQGMSLHYSSVPLLVPTLLPTRPVDILGATVGIDQPILLGIAVAAVIILGYVYRFTQFGRATSAVAENALTASAQGVSSDFVAAANWAIGCALAGTAGILLAPITLLSITGFTLLVIPALAAASLGRMNSFTWALAGGLILGIVQSEVSLYVSTPGWQDAAPFLLILVAMLIRGRDKTLRSQAAQRLSRVGSGRIRWLNVILALVVSLVFVELVSSLWTDSVTVTIGGALVVLSFVLVTGYTGQLSLAQFAFAGFGAWIAGRLAAETGAPFLIDLIVGVVACLPVGIIIGIICLRTRGANLAIATMGFALAAESVIFDSYIFTGGIPGTNVKSPEVFGLHLDPINHSNRYALMSIIVFTIAALGVANFRRGRSGRRALAVRANERGAAAVGIDVRAAKIAVFGIGAMIAGMGGVILAFTNSNIDYTQFSTLNSIQVATESIIGGVGWIMGPIIGATFQLGSITNTLLNLLNNGIGQYIPFAGGVLVIGNLLAAPDGVAYLMWLQIGQVQNFFKHPRRPEAAPPIPDVERTAISPRRLELTDLSVNFGGVAALRNVSLTVEPGKVTGLIGPNGAGKTTLIDATTGFVHIATGRVVFDGVDVTGWSSRRLADHGLVRSFQSLELFDDLTVLDNLLVASEDHRLRSYVLDIVKPNGVPITPTTAAVIREFRLESVLMLKPTELSYGMRRLVGIARAVSTAPSVLLLDEPAAGLDETERHELADLIRRLAEDWGVGVLLVEHDVDLVMKVSDQIYALNFGERIAAGTPEEIRYNQSVVESYLGVPDEADGGSETDVDLNAIH